jgi:cytochrome c-type biogenesis protein CcmF
VYLALVQPPDAEAGDQALIRVVVQPLVMWLWIGGGVMAAGTILAAFPGRRRSPLDPVSAAAPGVAAGATSAGGNGDGATAAGERHLAPDDRPGDCQPEDEPVEVST